MALTTVNITGTFNFPDAVWTDYAQAEFIISGYDTDTEVVSPEVVKTNLSSLGALDVDLWPNTEGLRGTVYRVYVNFYTDNSYTSLVKSVDFGNIQVTAAADIAALLDIPVTVPEVWYRTITEAEYNAAIAAQAAAAASAAAAATSETIAAASAAEAALYDGPWLDDVAALLADTSLTYTAGQPGTVAAGDYVRTRAEGFAYEIAASGATDHHVTTAGGVKLYVLPGQDGSRNAEAFGADASGATNSTDALKEFFDACIADGNGGHIPPGTYLITLGQLVFDNAHVDTLFPIIETAGHFAVTFKAAANIDAAFITITNGTASSGVGEFWMGGRLGGITFEKAAGSASGLTGMHGLVLRGMWGCDFGYMRADELGGSTIHIEQKLYGGSNPDPYNVGFCHFAGVEGNRNFGRVVDNQNWVGLNGCVFDFVRGIETYQGVFYGMGAANEVKVISGGSCAGWMLGDPSTVTGGASTRFKLGVAECDDVEYGIDTSISSNADFGICRFIHRYNFGPRNAGAGYWPRTCLKIGNPARGVADMMFHVIDRIEASAGSKSDLGVFADFTNAAGNLSDARIIRQVLDNAGFGIDNADLFTNFNKNSRVSYRTVREPIIDTLPGGSHYRARHSGSVAIPHLGFGTASNWVGYDTYQDGDTANYDTSTFEYTAPAAGWYSIEATLALAPGAGKYCRMGIYVNGVCAKSSRRYASTAASEDFTVKARRYLNVGDVVKISADQDSGSPVAPSGIAAGATDSEFTIEML